MSSYRQQTTNINDAEILCEALKQVGVKEVQRHAEPVQLEGYHGDKRKETAEVVIPRRAVGASSNDIGFKRGEDGNFTAIISSFDSNKYNAQWMTKLKSVYTEKKLRKQARVAGLTFVGRQSTPSGGYKLVYTKA